jgi:hypothetical protein
MHTHSICFEFQASTNFLVKSVTILVLVAVVAVHGAPSSNSTTSSGPGRKPVTSPRPGQHILVASRGGSNNSTKGIQSAGRSSSPTSSHPSVPASSVGGTKKNTTRVVRSTEEDDEAADSPQPGHGLKSSNTSSGAIPSTHPLFAHRQSSNITSALRPKLRGQPGSTSSSSSNTKTGSSASEEDDSSSHTKNESDESHDASPVRKTVSSSEDDSGESTIVSTGHVAVRGRNATRPTKVRNSDVASGTGTGKGRPTSSTHAPVEEEESAFF